MSSKEFLEISSLMGQLEKKVPKDAMNKLYNIMQAMDTNDFIMFCKRLLEVKK